MHSRFGHVECFNGECSACVRIVVSANGPFCFEWNTRPSCLTNCFSAFIAACPSASTRTTVLYAATFLHGPITRAPVQGLINTNRILADVIGAQRQQFTNAQARCSGEKKQS